MPLTGQSITLIILLRRMYAKASALLVSLLHPGSIAWERVGACNNAVVTIACSATHRFVLLIKRTYHVD